MFPMIESLHKRLSRRPVSPDMTATKGEHGLGELEALEAAFFGAEGRLG